jgi:esterase/lipase superfamily enzyme
VVLVSERDRVLQLSSFVAGGLPRLGEPENLETLRRLGVIVVDVSNFSDGTLGEHGAFQRSPELLEMIGSGKLANALQTGREGENLVVGALNAVGTVALAVAYFPYELTQ